MESRIMILFFMLLSLFLLFSLASAMLTALRRKFRCRLPSVVWGVLFILPLVPFSLSPDYCPARLELTADAEGNRVVSILPSEDTAAVPAPYLYASDSGTILTAGELPAAEPAEPLPEGLHIPAWLWETTGYLTAFALFFWSMLSLAYVTHRVCGYAGSIHYLTSRSAVCHDEKLCAIFDHTVRQVHLHRHPVLRVVEEGIHLSPCTAGLLTPAVYISHAQSHMAPDELEYIFLHELCHVKRHDFLLKALALLSTSVHFWAPFAGEVRRQVYEDCELGCDRMVLDIIGIPRRGRYMQTILTIAEQRLGGNLIRGELFSYASGGKELMLRRYRNLLEEKHSLSVPGRISLVCGVLAAAVMHMGMLSAVDTRPADNPLIDFSNPYLETVLREYYNLAPYEPVTMEHLDGIYSLEFSLSRKTEKNISPAGEDTLALCCLVNEGKYYLDGEYTGDEWAVILQQDGLADGISPDLQHLSETQIIIPDTGDTPLWKDLQYDCAVDLLPDVCPLTVLERYLPEDTEAQSLFLSYYTCLDGTEAALEKYATEVYMTVIRESALDVDAQEAEITAAFARYCSEHGIAFDAEKTDILGQLREHRRGEILALSPAALIRPMAFLDPCITEQETEILLGLLHDAGKLRSKCLTGAEPDATGRYAFDLSDLTLFENLRTVILNDRLTMADKTALTDSWCAVIER